MGKKKESSIELIDKALEKHLYENFKILRVIYGISYLAGFRELLLGFERIHHFVPLVTYLIGCGVLLLLAMRLFWGLGNIRRYLSEKIPINISSALDDNGEFLDKSKKAEHIGLTKFQWCRVMIVDIPILLIHSFIFYLLCNSLQEVILDSDTSGQLSNFLFTYSIILLLNVAWLGSLMTKTNTNNPEYIWFYNNMICGFLLFFTALIPLFNGAPTSLILWWAFFVAVGNSIFDLYKTGWVYLVGEPG